jgi:hypothetical protein
MWFQTKILPYTHTQSFIYSSRHTVWAHHFHCVLTTLHKGIAKKSWFDSRQGKRYFFSSPKSRQTPEPTQPLSFHEGKATETWSWPFTSIYFRGKDLWNRASTPYTPSWRLHSTFTNAKLLLLLSSVSPLCRISTLTFLRQTMSLGKSVLQLFWCNYSWCVYR